MRCPRLIEAARDHDVVIGSRYVDGRVNVLNWPMSRLFISATSDPGTPAPSPACPSGTPPAASTAGTGRCWRRWTSTGCAPTGTPSRSSSSSGRGPRASARGDPHPVHRAGHGRVQDVQEASCGRRSGGCGGSRSSTSSASCSASPCR